MLPDIYVYAPDLTVADGTITPAKLASSVYGLVGEISALGSVSAGSSVRLARADHVHPTTGLALLGSANAFTVGGHTITNASDVVPMLLRGFSGGQTANLLTIQDGGSTTRVSVSSAGALTVSPSAGTAALQLNPPAGTLAINIKAGDTSTAIFQIRNTADSAVLYSISDSGKITSGSGGAIGSPNAQVSVNAAASAVGLAVRLGSSGSADLTQWLANNGTTVLAKMSSAGKLTATIDGGSA